MKSRTTIYIPKDVLGQLDALKGPINISQICAEALRRELQRRLAYEQALQAQAPVVIGSFTHVP